MHLTSQEGIYYVITQHLAKKFERAFLTRVGRDGRKIAFCLQSFLLVKPLSVSENGVYELVNMFCHVGPDLQEFDSLLKKKHDPTSPTRQDTDVSKHLIDNSDHKIDCNEREVMA